MQPTPASQVFRVRALAIDPQTPTTLYAGTVGGVFKSSDGGVSWTASVITPYYSVRVDALAIDPKIPTTIYLVGLIDSAFGRWSALMKSVDGGGNWTDISSDLGPTPHITVNVGAFAIDPQTPATLYAGIDFSPPIGPCSGVFQSSDGGGSWGSGQ